MKVITSEEIIDIVTEYYRVERDELTGKMRHRHITIPRMVAIYLIKNNTYMTYSAIGRAIRRHVHEPMHHTSVMHHETTVCDLMDTNESFNEEIEYLQSVVDAKKKFKPKAIKKYKHYKLDTTVPEKTPIVRMEMKSPADKVREKYL